MPGEIFPFIAREKEVVVAIQKHLDRLWAATKGRLYHDCVVDVDVVPDTLTPRVVEFNPYHERGSTSPALFDWSDDRDILYGDGLDVVLRYSGSAFSGERIVELVF